MAQWISKRVEKKKKLFAINFILLRSSNDFTLLVERITKILSAPEGKVQMKGDHSKCTS